MNNMLKQITIYKTLALDLNLYRNGIDCVSRNSGVQKQKSSPVERFWRAKLSQFYQCSSDRSGKEGCSGMSSLRKDLAFIFLRIPFPASNDKLEPNYIVDIYYFMPKLRLLGCL